MNKRRVLEYIVWYIGNDTRFCFLVGASGCVGCAPSKLQPELILVRVRLFEVAARRRVGTNMVQAAERKPATQLAVDKVRACVHPFPVAGFALCAVRFRV